MSADPRGRDETPTAKRAGFVPPPPPPTLAYARPLTGRRPWIVRKWNAFREEAMLTLKLLPAGIVIMMIAMRWGVRIFLMFRLLSR